MREIGCYQCFTPVTFPFLEKEAWVKRKRSGVFALRQEDGTFRYVCVSALILIMYDFTYNDGRYHNLRMYHSPFAKYPVNSHIFRGVLQARVNLTTGSLEWERYAN